MDMVELTGGCLCGAIRYHITALPLDTGICHCRSCRKSASAASLAFTVVPTDAFVIDSGEPTTFASSPGVVRTFCGRCGAGLTYRNDTESGTLDVMTVSLDDPNACQPTIHLWAAQKIAWDVIADDLPIHPGNRSS